MLDQPQEYHPKCSWVPREAPPARPPPASSQSASAQKNGAERTPRELPDSDVEAASVPAQVKLRTPPAIS
eukprot:15431621-Alexandrium_andersonii.AAC.1